MGPIREDCVYDYLQGKSDSVAPVFVRNGKAFPSPSYAPTGANFNLREYQEDYKAGRLSGVFDQFMSRYPESPDSHSEPAVKRFYIDGKNAYDLFRRKYEKLESETAIRACIKADIMKAVIDAKQRVEFVQIERQKDGMPKAVVQPVHADLTVLDENKKWYQSSRQKQAEKLWSQDSGSKARREALCREVEERQRGRLLASVSGNFLYRKVIEDMKQAGATGRSPEQQGFDNLRRAIPKEELPEEFRSFFQTVRHVKETLRIKSSYMNQFRAGLSPMEQSQFDTVVRWESRLMKQGDCDTIAVPEEFRGQNGLDGLQRMTGQYLKYMEDVALWKREQVKQTRRSVSYDSLKQKLAAESTGKDAGKAEPLPLSRRSGTLSGNEKEKALPGKK